MKAVLLTGVALAALGGLVIGGMYFDRFSGKFYEETRHEVYKQSAAYNEGMQRDFQDLKRDYIEADNDPNKRAVIRSTILQRFSPYINQLSPSDLLFYSNVEFNR